MAGRIKQSLLLLLWLCANLTHKHNHSLVMCQAVVLEGTSEELGGLHSVEALSSVQFVDLASGLPARDALQDPLTGPPGCPNLGSTELASSCPFGLSGSDGGEETAVGDREEPLLESGNLVWRAKGTTGLVVGRHIRRLGGGRWGEVHEADVSGIGRAAVKLLSDAMIALEGDLEMSYRDFRIEAQLQERCQHPNVVRVHGLAPYPTWGNVTSPSWGRPDGAVVTELLSNARELLHVIADLADSDEGIPRKFRVGCALDIARGLAHVHAQGVIHFDVKPDNVLVDENGRCLLSDFGVAWDPKAGTIRYKGRGSIHYMAPELLVTNKPANTKVDVYSFGITMWTLLTGEEPYEGGSYDAIEVAVHNQERPGIDPDWQRFEPEYFELMTQCWRHPPHARPSLPWIVKSLEKMLAA